MRCSGATPQGAVLVIAFGAHSSVADGMALRASCEDSAPTPVDWSQPLIDLMAGADRSTISEVKSLNHKVRTDLDVVPHRGSSPKRV